MDPSAVTRIRPADAPGTSPPPPWPHAEAAIDAAVGAPGRLAEAAACGLLDPVADPAFDGVTELARTLLEVPASFVAVVNRDHDFYKSHDGFGEPLATTRRLQGRTFCHYTLMLGQTLAIEDTTSASPWREVPTVQSLGVRAYLGVPIVFAGQVVGSLCAIDVMPRAWTPLQVRTLQALAASLQREVALRRSAADAEDEAAKARLLVQRAEADAASIAHDMGTPLTMLDLTRRRLAAQLQRQAEPADLDPGVRNLLGHLEATSKAIAQLRNDIRGGVWKSARTDAGAPPTRQALSARSLLRDVHRLHAPIAERSGIGLVLKELTPARVSVDYGRFLRVLGNIVGNALKFTPAGARVTLSASSLPAVGAAPGGSGGPAVVFEVADQGAGMAADELARAFDRGFQGAASLARGDGTGLGLAIVREIVAEHGGTVTIDSAGVGKGCTVRVVVPVAQGEAVPGADAGTGSPANAELSLPAA